MKNIYNKAENILWKLKNVINFQKVLILIIFILILSIGWAYIGLLRATQNTFNNVESSEMKNIRALSIIIEKNIKYNAEHYFHLKGFTFDKIIKLLKKDKKVADSLNKVLSIYITHNIKYVYVVYKDKKGSYRYLLDGSLPISERGFLGQVFMPTNIKLWQECFKTGKDVYGIQNKNKTTGLWITYLHPIIDKGKIEAVLVLDVSLKTYQKLEDILAPARHYLNYMLVFITIILLCIFFQTNLLIKEQKRRRVDPLTGVYNRSYLNELEKILDLEKIAVAMVDIDFFKKINDTYGHNNGDIALRNVAKQLMLYTRNYDIVIRYGGEEFVVIFRNYDGKKSRKQIKDIIKVARRVQKKISSKPMRLDKIETHITVSMGIDPFTFKRSSISESIKMADEALYLAKNMGRNRVKVAKFTVYHN